VSFVLAHGVDGVAHVPEWFRNTETISTGANRHNPSVPQERPQAPQFWGSAAGSMQEAPQQIP
jgi:hypothetical protein